MTFIGDYGPATNLPDVRPQSSLGSFVHQPQYVIPWKACKPRVLSALLVFTFEPPISVCLSLGPLTCWFSQRVNAFVCPNFHWPSCLNYQCICMLSPYLDFTLESYPFPSWAGFRRNHYLSSSPCLCPWLLFMLGWRKSLV